MKLTIQKVSQRGYQDKLGTSSLTIDQVGCALACLTMVENYYGFKADILAINKLLIDKKVYMDRNLMGWWNIEKINEFVKCKDWIDCPTVFAPLDKIYAELDEGRPVIVQVDINPNQIGIQGHFILIIGYDEQKNFFAFDPWYKDEDAIYFQARYGDPKVGILGLRLISGPVPIPEAEKPDIAALQSEIEQYKLHIQDLKEHLSLQQSEDFPKVIGKIDELMISEKAYQDHLEKDKAESEKPTVPTPELKEEFLTQFKIWNLIIRLYSEKR